MTEVWNGSIDEWKAHVDRQIAVRHGGELAVEAAAVLFQDTADVIQFPVHVSESTHDRPEVQTRILIPTRRLAVTATEEGFKVTASLALSGELRTDPYNGEDIEIGDEHIVMRGRPHRNDSDRKAPHEHVSIISYVEHVAPFWQNQTHVPVRKVRGHKNSQKGSY